MKIWRSPSSNRYKSESSPFINSYKDDNDDNEGIFPEQKPKHLGFQSTQSSLPTRKQRMQFLQAIIHHADAIQHQFCFPQCGLSPPENVSGILSRSSFAEVISTNDKTYQRWQQVLQEEFVPKVVYALGLLERDYQFQDPMGDHQLLDEEDAYFETLQGVEEEMQVMAILARAASLNKTAIFCEGEIHTTSMNHLCTDNQKEECDYMEHINAMMKCTAMLLFHIVLMASPPPLMPSSTNPGKSSENSNSTHSTNSAFEEFNMSGYDGRIRHVMKTACVDVLTRAILEYVNSCGEKFYDKYHEISPQELSYSKLKTNDENSSWDLNYIKKFVDQHEIGEGAIFGNIWNKEMPSAKSLTKWGSKKQLIQQQSQMPKDLSLKEEQSSEDLLPLKEECLLKKVEHCTNEIIINDSSDHPEVGMAKEKRSESHDDQNEFKSQHLKHNLIINSFQEQRMNKNELLTPEKDRSDMESRETEKLEDVKDNSMNIETAEQLNVDTEINLHTEQELCVENGMKEAIHTKRQINAKFLATRKFELIERQIAIDVVRYLMAEEREFNALQKKRMEQKTNFMKVATLLSKGNVEMDSNSKHDKLFDQHKQLSCKNDEVEVTSDRNNPNDIPCLAETESKYWNAHRIKQIKRGVKIAGVGLTLGTIFAITGGLAAPALAAGIGGLASFTGAGTASSAAFLAVLATFKAGAALFGVGGGGIAAYKMKKRTAGLTDFSVRRENIDQYMYSGASEEKMKKGIKTMLPQLHTTVAVSGWLRDNDVDDFQLAWGVCPSGREEKAKDDAYRIRQLKRFYSVYNPVLVSLCEGFMAHLRKTQKKDFNWKTIWNRIERKYGASPDNMLPLDKPCDNEIILTDKEKEMIDSILNEARVTVGSRRGFLHEGIDFSERDELAEFLGKVSPTKRSVMPIYDDELETSILANVGEISSDKDKKAGDIFSTTKVQDIENHRSDIDTNAKDRTNKSESEENSSASGEVGNLSANTTSPKTSSNSENQQAVERTDEDYPNERCPIIWDWTRLYGSDLHTVTWESTMLSSLCHIVENLAMEVSSQATKVALQYSVLGAILSAVALPSALLTASKLIDDPYQIVVIRADEAGKELAKCLLLSDERRPVTLIGFSFGARVVYSCLRELARQQDIWEEQQSQETYLTDSFQQNETKEVFEYNREPASLIADAIFIGLPRVIDKTVLSSCRRVTGGRFINCYVRNDWLLSLMFVARGGTPCGTKPIQDVPGVENYDVTNVVESHTKYGDAIPSILKIIRFCEP